MNVVPTEIPGVLVIEPRVFRDARGSLFESWSEKRYADAGIPTAFVQDNVSLSRRGVLRGLHFQWPHPQGKLVQVLQGEVFDVAVDLRASSPTYGRWIGCYLSDANRQQLYLPPGVAHGFQVTSDEALLAYKCTEYYHAECEATLAWDDPDLAIKWPIAEPTLSDKDRVGYPLRSIPAERQPRLEALV